jgi:hypothetical protein
MTEKRGPGIGDARAQKDKVSGSDNPHLTNRRHLFKIAIDHVVTADMDDGQPLPPFIEDGVVWCVVRRRYRRTLWRRITPHTRTFCCRDARRRTATQPAS